MKRFAVAWLAMLGVAVVTWLIVARFGQGDDVAPGKRCDNVGSTGTYYLAWYVCRENPDGDMRWMRK